MSPRIAMAVIVVALALVGVAWILWEPTAQEKIVDEAAPVPEVAEVPADQPMTPASLYFLGEDGMLHGVEVEVPLEDGEGRIRALVDGLLAGPQSAGNDNLFLSSPLPAGVRLDGVYFLEAGSVALDLRLEVKRAAAETAAAATDGGSSESDTGDTEGGEEAPESSVEAPVAALASTLGQMGSKQEMLTIYSLVNTVAMGSGVVERVVLLLDGKQPETLSGHIDLTRPLRPDPAWISNG